MSGCHGDDNTCCLSDDVILRLAQLGIKVLIVRCFFCLFLVYFAAFFMALWVKCTLTYSVPGVANTSGKGRTRELMP